MADPSVCLVYVIQKDAIEEILSFVPILVDKWNSFLAFANLGFRIASEPDILNPPYSRKQLRYAFVNKPCVKTLIKVYPDAHSNNLLDLLQSVVGRKYIVIH